MNFKFFNLKFLIVLLVLMFFSHGCGKGDGFANSGTTNYYNFVYIGSLGSSTINSYYLNSSGGLVVAANIIPTGGGTSNVIDFSSTINGKFLYAANKASNNVSCYSIAQLTESQPGNITYQSVDDTGSGVSSIAVHPNGKLAYTTNSTQLTNNISFFSVNQETGVLNSGDGTTYTARTNPTELAFTPSGNYLYVVNRGTSDISSYSVNSVSGVLNTIDLSVSTGTNPEDLVIHPNGSYLYVLSAGASSVYQYRVGGGGVLSALSPASVSTGSGPKKIAITPNGKYLYVTNNTDNTFSVYSVNSSTGVLTEAAFSPVVAPSGAGVYSLAITSDSQFTIVSGDTDSSAYVFQIDDASGNITQVGSAVSLGGSNPRAVTIVPLSAVE